MLLQNNTAEIQNKLAAYCRTGDLPAIPGIDTENVKQYRRLVYNVIYGNITDTFPIFTKVVDDSILDTMVNEFFAENNCQTPQIWKLSKEFIDFAAKKDWAGQYELPWLNDLLLVEHIENEVFTMPDENFPQYRPLINYLGEPLAFNPEFRILNLNYPVHLMPVEQAKDKKGNYAVLVFRHPETKYVKFFNISPLYQVFITELIEKQQSIQELLPYFLKKYGIKANSEVERSIYSFIGNLYQEQFVLGALVSCHA